MGLSRVAVVNIIIVVAIGTIITCCYGQSTTSSDCNRVILELSPCLNYIQGKANTPSQGCCTQLANVVKTQPACLCQLVNGGGGVGSSVGAAVNQTLALGLPKACNVTTPPITLCKATSPSGSPLAPSSGSNIVPPEGGNSSDGSSIFYSMTSYTMKLITCFVAIILYNVTIFSDI